MTIPVTTTAAHCETILDEIQRVVVGKREALTQILTTVLAEIGRASCRERVYGLV